jgi:hypothetical protein
MHRPGIEPGSTDWKSAILPFNYRCRDALAGNRTLMSPLATAYSTTKLQVRLPFKKVKPNNILFGSTFHKGGISVDGFEPPT